MSRSGPGPDFDPYAVLGVPRDASDAVIAAAFRRAVRACHPDTAQPEGARSGAGRLADVLAAYQLLRPSASRGGGPSGGGGTSIPVRVHRAPPPAADLRAGPVRRHPRPH